MNCQGVRIRRSQPYVSSTPDSPHSLYGLLGPHLKSRLGRFGLALAIGLAIAGLGAAQPLLTRAVIDQGLLARNYTRLAEACFAILALALVSFFLGAWHRRLYVKVSGEVLFELRERVYAHLLAVSPRQLQQRTTGDLVSRLDGDIAEVQRFGTDAAAAAISGALGLVGAYAVMALLSWRLTLLVTVFLPLQWLIRHLARPRIEQNARDVRAQAANVGSFLVETLGNARGVMGAAAEAFEQRRLGNLHANYLQRVIHQQMLGYFVGSAAAITGHLLTIAVFLVGGWLTVHQRMSLGTLIAFVTFLSRGAGSAGSILGLYTGLQRARVSLGRIEDLLKMRAVATNANAMSLPATGGAISFKHVWLKGRDSQPLLCDINVEINSGAKIRLSGVSGAGKSTMADLLRRFLDPDSGEIRIDGLRLDHIRLGDLRRRVVVVEQTPMLISGTLWENLTYGLDDVSTDEVMIAAQQSGADQIAKASPLGYQVEVGERGVGLSSGQRQRIAIARLLVGDPLIVILDEATNALDQPSRSEIEAVIDQCFAGRTRIVISHHDEASTFDARYRLDDGMLLSVGPS